MSASVSNSGAKSSDIRGESGHMDLSKLRSQLTSTPSPTLDQTMMKSSRFREEERLRANIRRQAKLRREALAERISVMQDNMASELDTQHQMTLESFERDLRKQMEDELSKLESETLTREAVSYTHLPLPTNREV